MGQQQLLLIVLGVIVVGIALVIGIAMFSGNAVSSNRDSVVADLNNLGAKALQHYKKPATMGGGGNKFTGWTLPPELDTTANGNYRLTVAVQTVTIRGYGIEKAPNGNKIQHTLTVTPTKMTVVKNN
jgi:Tfp pilus assembly protein PilE